MDPRWYLAQSLEERLASLRERSRPGIDTNLELASKRLERWKADAPFCDDSVFQRFLSSINLSENEFKEVLGQNKEQIQESTAQPLEWVELVLDCLHNSTASHAQKSSSDFLALIDPLISHFRNKLQTHIDLLKSDSKSSCFQPETLLNLLTEEVAKRLRRKLAKTLILEVNIARLENRLSGQTKSERYESFIKLISTNEGRLAIYLEYPVLIRRVWQLLEQWYIVSCEFIDRFSRDYDMLNKQFDLGSSSVIAITGGAGDVHCQGRSVHIIEFANAKRIVYKPRSLAVDCEFRKLLQFLFDRGMRPDLKVAEAIDCGMYGWCEYIYQIDCRTESEIERFYERQGAWLALLYVLGTTDLHLENLIACGEHPVVIDLESLFHPSLVERKLEKACDLAWTKLTDSVMSVGLLPNPVYERGGSVDRSGIGAKSDQILPYDADYIEDPHTDEVYVGKAPVRTGAINSHPRLNGSAVEVVKYHRQIKKGFAATYRMLQSISAELLGKTGWFERFSNLTIRAIARATLYYVDFHIASVHPHFNHRALDQDFIARDLWVQTTYNPVFERIIASERRQLLSGDVPFFSTTPNSINITGGDGTLIASVLAKSGREIAEDRLRRMSDADLEFQLWLIEGALQTMSLENRPILQAKGYPRQCKDFLDAAIACGDRLVETAIFHLNQCAWIRIAGAEESQLRIETTEYDLYSGSLGIAHFLAYLYALTGQERYRKVADGCLNAAQANYFSTVLTPGAYAGISGLIYVNMHVAKLFKCTDLEQKTRTAFEMLPALIESDRMLDMISGCASAIPVLLAYASYFPDSKALLLARTCGEKLLRLSSPGSLNDSLRWESLTGPRGFAHGLSGIAFALSELAFATKEEKYTTAFIAAIAEESELLKGNIWTDHQAAPQAVKWCHGAAGIALSRLKIYEKHRLASVKDEAIRALHFLLASPPLFQHVLCHGALGNLEPLLLASQIFADDDIWHKELQVRSQQLLAEINHDGWGSKLPSQLIEPGLMIGLAGIGYQFLRLHASTKVPSVLVLDKPRVT